MFLAASGVVGPPPVCLYAQLAYLSPTVNLLFTRSNGVKGIRESEVIPYFLLSTVELFGGTWLHCKYMKTSIRTSSFNPPAMVV